ncbi:hypothetical protein [Salipiger marinus]|uniref:Sulfotransferase family protein n=1 Tax=Salipiger marinus TaxID=555512 RepID=A0A1G8QKF3_9RHOB|nr:hypothetical protein [Salipiger marinus]SDJ05289.1 hypothetical protein SAMN04487993_101646 [Salipiger marinus]
MSRQNTFLLGLGAQKAGSTWAQDYMAQDPVADFGPIKEYHVWDVLHLPHAQHFDRRTRNPMRSKAEATLRRLLGKGPDVAGIRGALQTAPRDYFDFFTTLLDRPGITLTGDITPLYAGLPPEVLKQIRDGFEARGIAVRALFLMRDPVSRCVSAAQMNRRKSDRNEGVPTGGTLDEAVLAYAQSPQARLRGDYRHTVESLRAVFPEQALYFGLYETMFTLDSLAALSRFAGVSLRPELARRRVNAFRKSEGVSERTRANLRDILEPEYAFCLQAFPETANHWMRKDAPSHS